MNESRTYLDLNYPDHAPPPPDLAARATRRARAIRRRRQAASGVAAGVAVLAIGGAMTVLNRPPAAAPADSPSLATTTTTDAPRVLTSVPAMVLSFAKGLDPDGPPRVARPATVGVRVPGTTMASLRWGKDHHLVLVTTGSGGCPFLPFSAVVHDDSISIETREYTGRGGCTLDLAATTIVMSPPAGVLSTRTYTVNVDRDIHLQLKPADLVPSPTN